MHACPRCWEVIEAARPSMVSAHAAEGSLIVPAEAQGEPAPPPRAQHAEAAPATEQLPAIPAEWAEPGPGEQPRPRKRRFWRLLLTALIGAVVLTVLLVALEAVAPLIRRTLPDQVQLVTEEFDDLGFAVGVPDGWETRREDVSNMPGVTVHEPADGGDVGRLRSFNIVEVDSRDYDRALQLADRKAPASAQDYREIDIVTGLSVDDRRAFRHRYTDGDGYREEWWVEHGEGTFRLEFSAPVSRREESAALYVRIARSFDVR